MKFVIRGNKIVCKREQNSADGKIKSRDIVEFDSHVDIVPPHVSSVLSDVETKKLKLFLEDLRRIRSNPENNSTILEALPAIIEQACDALAKTDEIDTTNYEEIMRAMKKLNTALAEVAHSPSEGDEQVKAIRQSEALKERLDIIKRNL